MQPSDPGDQRMRSLGIAILNAVKNDKVEVHLPKANFEMAQAV